MASRFLFDWRDKMQDAPELTSTDRHVGLVVSLSADVDGRDAYPGIRTIAKKAARKPATVIESIAWLEESGWIGVQRRRIPGTNAHAKSYYTLTIPAVRRTKADRSAWLAARKGGASMATRVVPEEVTPPVVSHEAAGVLPPEEEVVPEEASGVVPGGVTELSLTSPTNSPNPSSRPTVQRSVEVVLEDIRKFATQQSGPIRLPGPVAASVSNGLWRELNEAWTREQRPGRGLRINGEPVEVSDLMKSIGLM